MVQLSPIRGFSLCASVQQGGKYDNNLKYMYQIIRFVVTVRQLMQRYYGFPRSVCGLVVGMTILKEGTDSHDQSVPPARNDRAIFMVIAFSSP